MTTHERPLKVDDVDTDPGMTVLLHGEPPMVADPDTTISADKQIAPSRETILFADDELTGLRARWRCVQAKFVDDPRSCVANADGLVSDVIDKLTAGFVDARSRLETRWARDEAASTEDLRLALQYYREFFERLLAV
jgi:hypothetical protein